MLGLYLSSGPKFWKSVKAISEDDLIMTFSWVVPVGQLELGVQKLQHRSRFLWV